MALYESYFIIIIIIIYYLTARFGGVHTFIVVLWRPEVARS